MPRAGSGLTGPGLAGPGLAGPKPDGPGLGRPERTQAGRSNNASAPTRYGLARVISKRGLCSRSQAEAAIRAGRVQCNGAIVLNPEFPTTLDAQIAFDQAAVGTSERVYIMLNKPRGVIVSRDDEKARSTVFDLLAHSQLPYLAPVGRLDGASEGLLLLTNDSLWAAALTEPKFALEKCYHVQISPQLSAPQLAQLRTGIADAGQHLQAQSAEVLRQGAKTCWLEIVLTEGKNRHIRRMLAAMQVQVLRLIRVRVGKLLLGELAKGAWRSLTAAEVMAASEANN
jgi:23S rRNA pseudouridine2605 synthase